MITEDIQSTKRDTTTNTIEFHSLAKPAVRITNRTVFKASIISVPGNILNKCTGTFLKPVGSDGIQWCSKNGPKDDVSLLGLEIGS